MRTGIVILIVRRSGSFFNATFLRAKLLWMKRNVTKTSESGKLKEFAKETFPNLKTVNYIYFTEKDQKLGKIFHHIASISPYQLFVMGNYAPLGFSLSGFRKTKATHISSWISKLLAKYTDWIMWIMIIHWFKESQIIAFISGTMYMKQKKKRKINRFLWQNAQIWESCRSAKFTTS